MTWLSIIAKCFIIQKYSDVCANTHNSIAVLKVDGMVRNTVKKKKTASKMKHDFSIKQKDS